MSARRLLEAARTRFDGDREVHGLRDLMVVTGYLSATFQLEIREYHFPSRYRATARARRRSRGGPHGEAAALLFAQHYTARTAAPGFSLHGRGVALGFGCVTRDGRWIVSTGRFVEAWKRSTCFCWLEAHRGALRLLAQREDRRTPALGVARRARARVTQALRRAQRARTYRRVARNASHTWNGTAVAQPTEGGAP